MARLMEFKLMMMLTPGTLGFNQTEWIDV